MTKIAIKQVATPFNEAQMESADVVIVVGRSETSMAQWPILANLDSVRKRLQRQKKAAQPATLVECNLPSTHLILASVKSTASMFDLLTQGAKIAKSAMLEDPATIAVCVLDIEPEQASSALEALLAALLAAAYPLPSFKQSPQPKKPIKSIALYGSNNLRLDSKRLLAEAAGNNLARHFSALPTNHLTPTHYRKEIQRLADDNDWTMKFLDVKALQREKAGAFLAVAAGSEPNDAGIVHLRYDPPSKIKHDKRHLTLVGKGICFDTGGTNLKPAKFMHGMHEDMAGSAVALGTLLALTRLQVSFPVECWLALAQNDIGPKAYKQNSVVTAHNGTTIEIIHTDAEGRMVLADTLSLASAHNPGLIIDYATLTGSCIAALSSRYSGAFTNRALLHDDIIAAGRDSGERVWPFPWDEDFDSELESHVADVKQCTLDAEADHILATRFLSRFVANTPWLHIDLASSSHKGGLGHVSTDTTGFGVRFTLNLLLDKKVLTKLA